jgi:hypothetical protein
MPELRRQRKVGLVFIRHVESTSIGGSPPTMAFRNVQALLVKQSTAIFVGVRQRRHAASNDRRRTGVRSRCPPESWNSRFRREPFPNAASVKRPSR